MKMSSNARVVVAIDFGTTFSGFSFAKRSDPDKVMTFIDWPYQVTAGNKPYCKTQTSLYYVLEDEEKGDFKLQGWGWKGLVDYRQAIAQERKNKKKSKFAGDESSSHSRSKNSRRHHLLTQFKLRLASGAYDRPSASHGLSEERMIIDYLREISQFALEHLRKTYAKDFGMQNIEWCLTVPAIWDDSAKQQMKKYAAKAGMVDDPSEDRHGRGHGHGHGVSCSPFPVHIVLEPEAASVYCQRKVKDNLSLRKGDKIMVADIGGGTIDLVVHRKTDDDPRSSNVEEVVASYGDLGGGTYVDQNFMTLMCKKIGCFMQYCKQNQAFEEKVRKWWPEVKMEFDGEGYPGAELEDIPENLKKAWREYDEEKGEAKDEEDYEELRLEAADLKEVFDPEVKKVAELIERNVWKENVRVLMVVGGFSASPYLRKEICKRFEKAVEQVIIPEDPGTAISAGAVYLHIAEMAIQSRIARRTYGVSTIRDAEPDDPSELVFINDDNEKKCRSVFSVFVQQGERLGPQHSIKRCYSPESHNQKSMSISLFSSPDKNPKYTTSPNVTLEGKFEIDLSSKWYEKKLNKKRQVEVTMEFGDSLKVTAHRINFGYTQSPVAELSVNFTNV